MITTEEILELGLILDPKFENKKLLHFNGRKESKDFFGFDDGFNYILVYHPRTSVCLLRQPKGKTFLTLYAEQVRNIDEIKLAIEQL